jgi:type I restriction enzyme R subunit
MERWTEKEQTQAEVKMFILDQLAVALPNPPYTLAETEKVAERIYAYVWQRSASNVPWQSPTAA